jgi:hypothetical protein
MKISEIESCSFSRDGFPPHVKSPIIWGDKGNTSSPLCYLTKPKSMSKEDWEEFLDKFDFTLRR